MLEVLRQARRVRQRHDNPVREPACPIGGICPALEIANGGYPAHQRATGCQMALDPVRVDAILEAKPCDMKQGHPGNLPSNVCASYSSIFLNPSAFRKLIEST